MRTERLRRRRPASKVGRVVKTLASAALAALMALMALMLLAGCANPAKPANDATGTSNTQAGDTDTQESAVDVRVASLKGPTSIGLVSLMEKAKTDPAQLVDRYTFTIAGTADEIMPGLINGDIDIALVPANMSSVLYNRTEGAVCVISINALGVLYVVSADESITSLDDLAGRTVLMTGKGTTPDYVISYLLDAAGITDKVTLEFKSEATELAATISADPTAIAVLPEPYVTSVFTKNHALAVRLSLTEEWSRLQGAGGGELVTGVTVVRTAFLQEHPEAVEAFLGYQQDSVATVNASPGAAAQLVVDAGIIDNAAIAEQAIPRCNLVCITGDAMQQSLSQYLSILCGKDPASIGGALPDEQFYYRG